jgi:hypothetical protein
MYHTHGLDSVRENQRVPFWYEISSIVLISNVAEAIVSVTHFARYSPCGNAWLGNSVSKHFMAEPDLAIASSPLMPSFNERTTVLLKQLRRSLKGLIYVAEKIEALHFHNYPRCGHDSR